MEKYLSLTAIVLFSTIMVTGCDFIGGVFQTGIGVGIFVAVLIVILVFFILRIFRRR